MSPAHPLERNGARPAPMRVRLWRAGCCAHLANAGGCHAAPLKSLAAPHKEPGFARQGWSLSMVPYRSRAVTEPSAASLKSLRYWTGSSMLYARCPRSAARGPHGNCMLSRSSGRTGSGICRGTSGPRNRYGTRPAPAGGPRPRSPWWRWHERQERPQQPGPPPTSSRPLVPTKGAPAPAAHSVGRSGHPRRRPRTTPHGPAAGLDSPHVPDMPFPETDPEYVIASEPTVPKDMEEP